MIDIQLTVNGKAYARSVSGSQTLLHFLRDTLGLIGTKEGCGAGECGACTVFFDGRTVNACMVLAVEADGKEVETIEGEAHEGQLSRIQEAFHKHHAVQCGFCTSGMILSTRELLRTNPKPSVEDIKDGIEGNFCRCTGYQQIIEAVLEVSGQTGADGQPSAKGVLKHA